MLFLLLLLLTPINLLANQSHYFLETYGEGRAAFRQQVRAWETQGREVQKGQWEAPSLRDNDLTADWAYLPPKGEKDLLIILVCGVHGIETFATSAIQRMFMKELYPTLDNGKTGLLLIHSLNPYGHKYSRRVTENNVDLNRNFIHGHPHTAPFQDPNPHYRQFNSFLNPQKPVTLNFLAHGNFLLQSLYYMARYPRSKLRQAIVQGQYSFPEGLFYGGSKAEPQALFLKNILEKKVSGYKKNFIIDLHTGYGERGKLHFLGLGHNKAQFANKAVEQVFEGYTLDTSDNPHFYSTTGDFPSYASSLLKKGITVTITFEYGTLNSQTTTGSLKSLQRVRLENQGFRWGYQNPETEREVKHLYREMFSPTDPSWRQKIMETSTQVFPVLIQRFQNFTPQGE